MMLHGKLDKRQYDIVVYGDINGDGAVKCTIDMI